ncbi:unnamed protein product [Candidula unifasciata]|uniref:Glutathione S-transferase n=1 Tax=Candidula unifasciata TaxID=100452 RepID=A0A8S3ZMV6_9EUPU|nr:unnamed protein product [Candidula unifasciata]
MASNSLKLFYYDAKGRAELIRLVLAAGGREYENVILTQDDWQTEKYKTPFGQLPVMEIGGKKYAQSIALANYCAAECGLYGKTNLDRLNIDQVVCLGSDLVSLATQAFHEKDETRKAEKMKNFAEVEAPRFFNMYEKLLKESSTGYFCGDSLTLADLFIYDQVFTESKWKTFKTEGFPLLNALRKLVESNEKIKAYLATRKPTEF